MHTCICVAGCQTNEFLYKYTNNMLPMYLLINFNKFILQIYIIFAMQLIIIMDQSFVVSMVGNLVLDIRDPQRGRMILLTAVDLRAGLHKHRVTRVPALPYLSLQF